jgi:hypothetical protein
MTSEIPAYVKSLREIGQTVYDQLLDLQTAQGLCLSDDTRLNNKALRYMFDLASGSNYKGYNQHDIWLCALALNFGFGLELINE